jgi:hypothetical protein
MPIQVTDLSALLEKIIRPAVEDQFTNEATLWQIAQKNFGITRWAGLDFYIPIRTARFPGVYALPEGAALISGGPTFTQAKATAKTMTGSFTITEQALSVKDAGAVVPILTNLSQAMTRDLVIDLNRQLWGTGDAVLGTANGAGSSSTSLTLAPQGGSNGDIKAEDILVPGQYIQIGSNAGVQVTAVSGNTVTLASAQSWSDGATVKKVISAGASPTAAAEITGFGALFSNSTYLDVNPTNYPTWQAYVDSTAATLSLADMHKAYLKAKKVGNPKYIFMNKTLFAKYGSLLESQMRFTPKQVLGAGWIGLDYMGGNADVVLDHFCPDDWVAFIDPKMLTVGELKPLDFLKGNDGTLMRKIGYLEYEVVAVWMGNLATFARAAHALLKNRTA